jgi:hypothetical protein
VDHWSKAADDHPKIVITTWFRKWAYKVHRDRSLWSRWNRQAMQKFRHSLSTRICHLTNRAHFAILLDVLSDARPPVMAPYVICCFLQAKMPKHFMCLCDNYFS